MKKDDLKPAAWGAVGGAIVMMIAMFASGWAVTGSSAREMAGEMTEQAVLTNLAPICVAQFALKNGGKAELAELKALEYWKRPEYVENKGWATMPGSETPAREISSECAKLLLRAEG